MHYLSYYISHQCRLLANYFQNVITWIKSEFKKYSDIKTAKVFRKSIEELQNTPIKFYCDLTSKKLKKQNFSLKELKKQKENHIKILSSNLSLCYFGKTSLKKAINKINRQFTALLYSLEKVNGGLSPKKRCSENTFENIKQLASNWKANIFCLENNRNLTARELDTVTTISRYKKFAKLVAKDSDLLNKALEWAFINQLPIEIFIEYPSIPKLLKKTELDCRIGRFATNLLKITKKKTNQLFTEEKTVELKLGKKFHSLLINKKNENKRVTFPSNIMFMSEHKIKLKDLIYKLSNPIFNAREFEMTESGLIRWNSNKVHKFLDFSKEDWISQLPVFQTYSKEELDEKKEELESRYKLTLSENSFGDVLVAASQGQPGISATESHAWVVIIKPLENERFAIYPFGLHPKKYPKTLPKKFTFPLKTHAGIVRYPDDAPFKNRKIRSKSINPASKEHMENAYKKAKKDFQSAKNKNLIYQLLGNNCGVYTQDFADAVFKTKTNERFFSVSSETLGLKKIVSLILDPRISIILGIDRPYFSTSSESSEIIENTLATHPNFRIGEFNIPAHFIEPVGNEKSLK